MVSMLALVATLALQAGDKEPPRVLSARTALEKDAEDPKANLTVGLYLATKGDWAAALPLLARSKDKDIAPAAEREAKGPATGFDWVEVGDLWLAAALKRKDVRAVLRAHAADCYGRGWDALSDDFWRGKLREKLKALLTTGPATKSASGKYPKGWKAFAGGTVAGIDYEYARTGRASIKFAPQVPKDAHPSAVWSDKFPIPEGATVTLSGWFLTDGDDGAHDFTFSFHGEPGVTPPGGPRATIKSDRPFWTKVEIEAVAPVKCKSGNFLIVFNSQKGRMFMDDLSLTVNGKELLPSPSLE